MTPPRYQVTAPIVAQENILGAEYELTFFAPDIANAAQPGQFVEIVYGDGAPLLRRPFSLFTVDRDRGTCRVFYRTHGAFTNGLSTLGTGETISVLGPLGRPFTWSLVPGTKHILVAGGIGAPPLHFLASELCRLSQKPEVLVLNGARTEELLVGMIEFGSLGVELIAVTESENRVSGVGCRVSEEPTNDEGERENHGEHGGHGENQKPKTEFPTPDTRHPTPFRRGLVTEVLNSVLDTAASPVAIYACGPMPMLRAVSEIAIARTIPCQVSIETSMPCGIGLCQGCAVAVRGESAPETARYALACVDGPVFDAGALVWAK